MDIFNCYVCGGNKLARTFEVPEHYFGRPEIFVYDQCDECGTISIRQIPLELGSYYGSGYYSMKGSPAQRDNTYLRLIRRFRTDYCLKSIQSMASLGGILAHFTGRPEVIERYAKWMRAADICSDSKIADIGCGKGSYLWGLYHEGMNYVFGFDPFLDQSIKIGKHGFITNTKIDHLPGNIEFMLMNHSLEHVVDPYKLLRECHHQLIMGGYLLVRIPVADNSLLETYGVHWVGLDAPRHIHIFSEKGAKELLERSGFTVITSERYTHLFQWVMSEQLSRGIPLASPESFAANPLSTLFSANQLHELQINMAKQIAKGEGDCVTIFARKS